MLMTAMLFLGLYTLAKYKNLLTSLPRSSSTLLSCIRSCPSWKKNGKLGQKLDRMNNIWRSRSPAGPASKIIFSSNLVSDEFVFFNEMELNPSIVCLLSICIPPSTHFLPPAGHLPPPSPPCACSAPPPACSAPPPPSPPPPLPPQLLQSYW